MLLLLRLLEAIMDIKTGMRKIRMNGELHLVEARHETEWWKELQR